MQTAGTKSHKVQTGLTKKESFPALLFYVSIQDYSSIAKLSEPYHDPAEQGVP
jgi:hypothetical protein